MVVDPEHGTIDSPLHPDHVRLCADIPETVARLCAAGFQLSIVSNQPGAAKGKTTQANLLRTHTRIVELAQAKGGTISSSHLCFHRQEDQCQCRKPKTGLLEEAFKDHPHSNKTDAWMVGDGLVDLEAGQRFGVKTAFLHPRKPDAMRLLGERDLAPTFWGHSLKEFADYVLKAGGPR